ncbi:HAD family phosphatase [Acidimicrobiia bacterium EGI L10123]|uniref:HAD family hydrolase n=1 Tax=Salinilacustrithrix flava TaxID=2957203 RepID=UPI003D7C1E8B|nr:HAD family phosphatase [Acidimicrobiia bacterium EGI L10123]
MSADTAPVVLFDVDGTLTDTNYLHTLAWRRAFLDNGHDVASWRIHRLIGASGTKLMEDCIGREDEDVKSAWRSHFEELAPEVQAFPGARDLIRTVQDRGGRAVLATSSPEDLVAHHLRALDLDESGVDGITTDTDVAHAKPAPDVFLTALAKADGAASRAVVIGDTGWDLQAAKAAGIGALAVRTGGWGHDELVQAGAVEVHDDVGTLCRDVETSALGDLLRGA